MTARVPAANISESDLHYHIELAAPGLKKEDFKLSLDRNVLSVNVEQQKEQSQGQKSYNKREFSYGSWVRSFTLPDSANVEQIDATYNDGILMIDIAKREEAKAIRRQIEIK
ncbi:Hsp20/alpha crystallin family protein [Mucilaginibacter myungsuensis]|nr:Hsp20/alpha crystallin family protein [Mucilaginibacter myungsuensis]